MWIGDLNEKDILRAFIIMFNPFYIFNMIENLEYGELVLIVKETVGEM